MPKKKKKVHYYKSKDIQAFSVLPVPKWLMPKMNEVYLEFVKYGLENGLENGFKTSKRDYQYLVNMFAMHIFTNKPDKFEEFLNTALEFSQKLEEEKKNNI